MFVLIYNMVSVPLSQIEAYLTFLKNHDTQLSMLTKLKDDSLLDVAEYEVKLTWALLLMHETVDKLLKENNII